MSLRAVEEDVAHILEASGLGSTTSTPPTIYAGPLPAGAPEACIACLESSSEPPEKYLSGARLAYHRPEVTVLVRGTAGDSGRLATAERARAAWAALWDLHLPEYVKINPLNGGPVRVGPDANGRAQYSFTVQLEYVLATTSGITIPLPARGPLYLPALEVAGEAKVSGLLLVPALPFAGFPSPASKPGGVLFDTVSGLLHVSNGSAWLPVGGPQPVPAAGEVPVAPAGNLSSTTVQAALEELQADVDGRATAAALGLKADVTALSGHAAAASTHGVAGNVVGTTDAQTISNKKHSGLLEVLDVSAGAAALRIPSGSWLKLGGSGTNADVILWDGSRFLFGATGAASGTIGSLTVGTEIVLQGGVLRRSTTGTISYSATHPTLAHRLTSSTVMSAGGVVVEVAQPSGAGGAQERKWAVDRDGKQLLNTGDSRAAPGNATLNTPAGKSSIPAGSSSIVITSACCTTASLVRVWVQQAAEDATLIRVRAVPAAVAGSFTIYGNAPATSDVVVAWEITN